jgi:protoporphyrinogen oxidase
VREKRAIIIGAGPAGLTAAYELLVRTDIRPIVIEASLGFGGISRTVNYKGNRIDIGGHRFFSKSDRVMDWWQRILPVQRTEPSGLGPDPAEEDRVMLVRARVSRVLYLRKFFDYPISLNFRTLRKLGIARVIGVALSYISARVRPVRPEKSLEDFFINRFGRRLYRTFFKDYTEKVWGVPCTAIRPEWGAQRIKGFSIGKAVLHAAKKTVWRDRSIGQKETETTLIEQFLYPKFGPGQMWETVGGLIREMGGQIRLGTRVTRIRFASDGTAEIVATDVATGDSVEMGAEYIFSTMPVKELITSMGDVVPDEVREVANGLVYRDFITVGLLLNKLLATRESGIDTPSGFLGDNWIYVQEPDVRMGRLQIFNNWSPYMVKDPRKMWLGLEYFCNENDDLWSKSDTELSLLAARELATIGIIDEADVVDATVIRMAKTYPGYFGSFDRFSVIRDYTDRIGNLFLIGRNGMHRYNNQDHSMLTAMTAVDNIVAGVTSKDNIWSVNTEQEYHESKK